MKTALPVAVTVSSFFLWWQLLFRVVPAPDVFVVFGAPAAVRRDAGWLLFIAAIFVMAFVCCFGKKRIGSRFAPFVVSGRWFLAGLASAGSVLVLLCNDSVLWVLLGGALGGASVFGFFTGALNA